MKVVTQNVLDLFEPERKVKFNAGLSERILLEKDGMGFSLHRTIIPKGGPYRWHYKNHLEACYCVSGLAQVVEAETKRVWIIEPGDTYVLDNHDNHTFEALEDTVLISVFNPPVTGAETHDEDGSYSIDPKCNKQLASKIADCVYQSKSRYDAIENIQAILNGK